MAIKLINDGSAAVLNLEKDKREHLIIDFYRIAQMMSDRIINVKKQNLTTQRLTFYFTENEHEIITDYLGRKITLNNFSIEDLIDLEDAIDDYLYNVYCKNLPDR